MIHGLLTALGTTAGKVAAGVALTAAAAGGVVATEVVDLPSVESSTIEQESEIVEELEVDREELEVVEEETATTEAVEADEDEIAAGDEDDADEDTRNHGQQVSEMAQTTKAEGCEKGQEISEFASSKADEKRQNEDKEDSPCKDHEEEEEEEEEEDEVEDNDKPGKGNGGGQGRDKN